MNTDAPSDPLAALKPIHPPDSVPWWPLAPGWWLLLSMLVVATLLAVWWWRRGQLQRTTLKLLKQATANKSNATTCAAAINDILKRYALQRYPREQVAGLTGKAWGDFLDSLAPSGGRLGAYLTDLPYRENAPGPDCANLYQLARRWLRHQRHTRGRH